MVASVAAMLNLLKRLWFDGELYKFHHWFHMIYILIVQLRGASFILWMKSRVLLRSKVGLIMVSICLHGVISWSQASGRGRFSPNKNCHSWKIPPICLKILLDMDSMQYFKQNDQVLWRCLFIWACEGLSIPKALHINVWEMAGVTAMAAGCEQTQSAHARDVSLGARITPKNFMMIRWWEPGMGT